MKESIEANPVTSAVAGMSNHCHTHLHAAIDLTTRIEPALLRRALVEVAKAVPELRGRFRYGFWRSRWDIDPDPRWRIEEHETADPVSAEAIERELFARPFEPCGILPLELEILHLPSHDRLLARVSHFLCDGGGTKNLLYRIAAAYRALREDNHWTAPEELFRPSPLPRLLAATRGFSLWKLLRGVLRDIVSQGGGPFLSVPMKMDAHGPDRFISLHIPSDRVRRLKQAFLKRAVTINDMALFALVRALESVGETASRRSHLLGVMATADFRLYLSKRQEDVSNLSVVCPLRFGEAKERSDEELLDAIVLETSSWKKGATGLGGALLSLLGACIAPHWLSRRAFSKLTELTVGRMGRRVALTNMGLIDEDRLDFGNGPCLAARITSPVGKPPQLIAAMTGCRGAIDFNITWRESAVAPDLAATLIAQFDAALFRLEHSVSIQSPALGVGEQACLVGF